MTAESQRDFELIAGVLIAPAAMLTNLLAGFVLAPWVCANHWEPALHGVHLAFLLISVGGGWLAWRHWRRAGASWPDESAALESRVRFMAVVGLTVSVLCVLQIVGSIAASFILGACQ